MVKVGNVSWQDFNGLRAKFVEMPMKTKFLVRLLKIHLGRVGRDYLYIYQVFKVFPVKFGYFLGIFKQKNAKMRNWDHLSADS